MVNVVLDAKNQSLKLCAVDGVDVVSCRAKIFDGRKNICLQHKYHTKIDDHIEKTSGHMRTRLIAKLTSVLEKTLGKLSSFDEGSVTGMLLGFAVGRVFRRR